MRPKEAARVAADAVGATGECSVCGRVGAITHNGRRMRNHQRTIVHREADEYGPAVVTTVDCRGSRRPCVEYAQAFKEARAQAGPSPAREKPDLLTKRGRAKAS